MMRHRAVRPCCPTLVRVLAAVLLSVLAAGAWGALPAQARPAAQSGDGSAWLDRSPLVSWNLRGAPVPQAPRLAPGDVGAASPGQCASQDRPAVTPEERAVAGAGWRLFDAPAAGPASADVRLISGTAGYDGMCRPAGYQQFVFVGGRFAGTIAPTPMVSRADGAGAVHGPVGPNTLTAVFARYGESDPACCPSRETTVTYRIDPAAGAPVLVPTSATTGAPGSAPPPASAPPLGPLAPGTVVALRGTPHLWVAEADGALHWIGDTRALAERPVNWSSRQEAGLDQLRAARLGDPFLSAGLVRRGDRIYLAKWEQGEAAPVLLHIQSIADVQVFGITSANYGRFVLDEGAWDQRYGFAAAALRTGELAPAAGS